MIRTGFSLVLEMLQLSPPSPSCVLFHLALWWKPAGKLQLAQWMVSSVMLHQCVPHRNAQILLYIRIFIPVMSCKIGKVMGSTFFSTLCISNVMITYALPLLLFAILCALMGTFHISALIWTWFLWF